MFDSLISLIAPHSCVSCGRRGLIMCPSCLAETIDDRDGLCIKCGRYGADGICGACALGLPYDDAVVFSERTSVAGELINLYKFSGVREAHRPLARLLAPLLPRGPRVYVVPVPTVRRHVRERGYDHMALIAKQIARQNGSTYTPLLARRTGSVQLGARRGQRVRQAQAAFVVDGSIDVLAMYVVCDDVTTTGASLEACAAALKAAGARTVVAAALVRQPLDGRARS